jgi:poly(A) polymerase
MKITLPDNTLFRTISEISESTGQPCYLIGGYVRDLLLKRKSKDIDVVVVGNGISTARKVASTLGVRNISVYKNFGTALLKQGDREVEFVGARKESYRQSSRKPIVENGTLEDDMNRRDFTVNALAISLQPESYGELIDPFGGLHDLKQKLLRTPLDPDTTYCDDPLRMMRAIRFATQLYFTIDGHSFEAIKRNRERIAIISMERIIDELNKIILADTPSLGFKLLDSSGLLKLIFKELDNLKGVDTVYGKAHKDNFLHTLQVLDNVARKTDNIWLRWTALLHDIAKPKTKKFVPKLGWTFHAHDYIGGKMVPGIFRRLKLPLGPPMKYVQKLVQLHLRPIALVEETVTLKRNRSTYTGYCPFHKNTKTPAFVVWQNTQSWKEKHVLELI